MSATPVPLTEAERAALAAMMGNPSPQNCWCDWAAGDLPCDDCSLAARAVVAAVRGPLLRESADRMLQHATDAESHDATEDSVYTFMAAANCLREWASLSRPTSEETP